MLATFSSHDYLFGLNRPVLLLRT